MGRGNHLKALARFAYEKIPDFIVAQEVSLVSILQLIKTQDVTSVAPSSVQMAEEAGLIMRSMRILSWNYRGVGKAPTVRALKTLARGEALDVLFLAETKVKSPRIDHVRSKMGFYGSYCVDAIRKAGGLALFWKTGVELEVVF